jgi:hypothetical protein
MLYQPIAATTYCMCRVLAPNLGGFSVAYDEAGVRFLDIAANIAKLPELLRGSPQLSEA